MTGVTASEKGTIVAMDEWGGMTVVGREGNRKMRACGGTAEKENEVEEKKG